MSLCSQSLSKQLRRNHKRSAHYDTLAHHFQRSQELAAVTNKVPNVETQNRDINKVKNSQTDNKPFLKKNYCLYSSKTPEIHSEHKEFKQNNIDIYPMKSTYDTAEKMKMRKEQLTKGSKPNRSEHSKSMLQDYEFLRRKQSEIPNPKHQQSISHRLNRRQKSKKYPSASQNFKRNFDSKLFTSVSLNHKIEQRQRGSSLSMEDKVTANILKNVTFSSKKNKFTVQQLKDLVKLMVMDQINKVHEEFSSQTEEKRILNRKKVRIQAEKKELSSADKPQDCIRISKLASLRSMDNSFYEQNYDEYTKKDYSQNTNAYQQFLDSDLEMDCLQQIKHFSSKDQSHEGLENESHRNNRKERSHVSDQVQRQLKTQDLIENYLSVLKTEDMIDPDSNFKKGGTSSEGLLKYRSEKEINAKPLSISKRQGSSSQSHEDADLGEISIGMNSVSQEESSEDRQNSLDIMTQTEPNRLFARLAQEVREKMAAEEEKPTDILEYIYSRLEKGGRQSEAQQLKPEIETGNSAILPSLPSGYKNSAIQIDLSSEEEQLSSVKFEASLNQDLRNINFQILQEVLLKREKRLQRRRQKQISRIQEMHDSGKLSYSQYVVEKQKMQKWIKLQLKQIQKARKDLLSNYTEVTNILGRTSKEDHESTQFTQGIMRCLSDKYIGLTHKTQLSNEEILPVEVPLQKPKIQEVRGDAGEEESMEAIREAFIQMKEGMTINSGQEQEHSNHNTPEESPSISQDGESYLEQRRKRRLSRCCSTPPPQSQQSSQVPSQSGGEKLPLREINQTEQISGLEDSVKDDICEFIFLDLCIEIYSENVVRDNPQTMTLISDSIKEIASRPAKRKGMKTDLKSIKDFLADLHQFLSDKHSGQLKRLAVPIGPTPEEILKYMHQSDQYEETLDNGPAEPIFPNNLFDKFELKYASTVEFSKYYDDQVKEKSRIQFLKSRQYVYHKAIFDALNEHLDHQRTFGRKGKPFPWKSTSQFEHDSTVTENLQILRNCMSNVYIDASYLCGIIVDKEDSLFAGRNISEHYIEQIRQDRVGRMMANQLLDQEFRWLFYDDDQAQILLEMARELEKQIIAEESAVVWAIINARK